MMTMMFGLSAPYEARQRRVATAKMNLVIVDEMARPRGDQCKLLMNRISD